MSDHEAQGASTLPSAQEESDRRDFLGNASSLALASGLVASYGTFAYMSGSFMYPAHGPARAWVFVTELARMQVGDSLAFRAPNGERIAVARQGDVGTAEDFVALSSTCPHLGCQVHWEGQNDRFFCPCHNGVFDRQGKGIGGPPGDAGQVLPRYPLRVEKGLLFIEAPTEGLGVASVGPGSAGHDACLQPRPDDDRGELA